MKTLYISIIIVVAVTASAIIIAILANSIPQNQIPVYQYEIHEPYQGAENDRGTITIQNQTFHVANLDTIFTNKSRPEWIQFYDVNFSFPNGIELQNTPGGQIFETYVTFLDNPVPYRLGIGLGPSPNSPNYEYNTVLSTHKEPQAGLTIHNGTIQILVNWSKIHSDLNIINLNDTYRIGQPINFQIEAKGFDYFDGGEIPRVSVERLDGSLVWSPIGKIGLVLCCPAELVNYDKKFNLTDLGGPIMIDKNGSYNLVVTYNDQKIQKQFMVIPIPTIINSTFTQAKQVGKDIILQKPSSDVKPFPRCNPSPAKEKLIREKVQILSDALLAEETKYGGFENRTQNLPWSGIGYDCVDNALEVNILPQYFNADSFPKYFEKIRSIVGNEIDIVLSPLDYPTPV